MALTQWPFILLLSPPSFPEKFCARHVRPPDGIPSVDGYKFPLLLQRGPSFSFFLFYSSIDLPSLLRPRYQVVPLAHPQASLPYILPLRGALSLLPITWFTVDLASLS